MIEKIFTRKIKTCIRSGALAALGAVLSFNVNAQVLINENFSSASGITPPAGWSNTDNGGSMPSMVWEFNNPGGRNITGAFSGQFAILDSDHYGYDPNTFNGYVQNADLEMPAFNASSAGSYVLEFDNSSRVCCGAVEYVEVWNGSVWTTVLTMPSSNNGYPNPPNHKTVDITAAAGGSTAAKVRFHYEGAYDYWWAIDNVKITRLLCTAPSATFTVTPDCPNSQYSVSVDITSLGSATSVAVTDGTTTYATATAAGTFVAGPFGNTSVNTITLVHNLDNTCNVVSVPQTYSCPPPNDLLCNAIELSIDGAADCQGTTAATSTNDPSSINSCSTPNNTVWYKVVPPSDGQYMITMTNPAAGDPLSAWVFMYIVEGDCNGTPNFTPVPFPNSCQAGSTGSNGSSSSFLTGFLSGGQEYHIIIDGNSGDVGAFCISLATPPAPPSCVTNATPANGTTNLDIYPAAPTFTWNREATATSYNFYLGSSAATATNIGSLTDTFATVNGLAFNTTYYWYVAPVGVGGSAIGCETNAFSFTTEIAPPPPPNDNICEALPLTVNPTTVCVSSLTGQTTISATQSLTACTGTADDDIWYSFSANTTSVNVSISDEGLGSTDRVHEVFSSSDNTCTGTLTSLSCSDPESSTVSGLTIGNTYFIRVHSYSSGDYATFGICVSSTITPPPPVNDEAPGAVTLTVNAGCAGTPYYNVSATQGATEPFTNCKGTTGYNSVWFKFVAPASGSVKISNDGGGGLGDSRMALFSAVDVNNYGTYTILACDDDNGVTNGARSLFYASGLAPGSTYYIVVDGYSAFSTTGTFCVRVDELNASMLASGAGSCISDQGSIGGYNGTYTGWISLVDANGNLNANVRQTAGAATGYTSVRTITSGASRTDVNGLAYLNRNFQIEGSGATAADLQLFFLDAEVASLGAPLASLNVSRAPGSTCTSDAAGTLTTLTQTASGSANGVSFIQVSTPGFSNFFIMSGTTPLPVDLENISAANADNMNRIDWTTAREEKGDYFELERSIAANRFDRIATIQANGKAGAYTYWDKNPVSGANYYRLKIVSKDGSAHYSKVVSAIAGAGKGFSMQALPNPVTNMLTLKIGGTVQANAQVTVSDITGRVMNRFDVKAADLNIDMGRYAQGIYLIKYSDAVNTMTLKINKQ